MHQIDKMVMMLWAAPGSSNYKKSCQRWLFFLRTDDSKKINKFALAVLHYGLRRQLSVEELVRLRWISIHMNIGVK